MTTDPDYTAWLSRTITAGRRAFDAFRAGRSAVGMPPVGKGYVHLEVEDQPGRPSDVRTVHYMVDTRAARPRHTLIVHLRDGSTEVHPVLV